MRLALVTPWFGGELIGGAERLAWDLSHALVRARVDVDVLATTCRSFHDDWSANYHRPGASNLDGMTLRRFRVDSRDRVAFSRANSALLSLRRDELRRDLAPLPREKTDAFLREGIRSSALLQHLQAHGNDYDALVFLPYLYGTTIEGVPLVADRAFLLPCVHDEAYAYLDGVRDVFRKARGLLFNSDGELSVAASLYGPWVYARGTVIGHSVDVAVPPAEPKAIRGFVPQRSRYLLFLGRGDRTKNIDLALDAFARFRALRRTTSLQLLIAGPHTRAVRGGDGVIDLGAVTEEDKAALLAHARALVQPSTNESFSRTVYEAWHLRRPVVVHTDCAATAELVNACGGGWIARTADEWASVFTTIDESSDAEIDSLGVRGRAVALQAGSWDDVAARTLEAIRTRLAQRPGPAVPLEQWAGPRPAEPRYDDGALNIVSLAPLDATEAEGLLEIAGYVRKKAPAVRLFIFEESCTPEARETLVRLSASLRIPDSLVFLGDDVAVRFAALRDAQVACAFGAPLQRRDHAREAMWFDLPVVAYEDPATTAIVSPTGVLCDRSVPKRAAMLLFVIATDARLRSKIASAVREFRGAMLSADAQLGPASSQRASSRLER